MSIEPADIQVGQHFAAQVEMTSHALGVVLREERGAQAEALARVLTYYVVGELVSGLTPDARYNSAVADIICKPR